MANNTERMQEIANRGLQDQLPAPLRARFDEAVTRQMIVVAPLEFTAPDSPELRKETTAMIADLPAVDPATIHPTSEVVVRAQSLVPQRPPETPIDFDDGTEDLPPSPIHPEAHQIARDEGSVDDGSGNLLSYKDSLGKLTGGIGHLMTPEERKLYPEGVTIPNQVVDDWFTQDLKEATDDAENLLSRAVLIPGATLTDIKDMPEGVRAIIINMAFNLGRSKLKGFKKMWEAISRGDWGEAADEMVDSLWFKQTGTRSRSLVARMRQIQSNTGEQ